MIDLASRKGTVKANQEAVFNYIADFRNFAHLLPSESLSDIQVTVDTLRFGLPGLGDVGLKIAEKDPFKQLVIKAIEGTSADFTLWINIDKDDNESSIVYINLQANLNMFLEMMARGPLQKFLDLIIDKLELIHFSPDISSK
jgi:carbon monoxide dehydrogenase subunit G